MTRTANPGEVGGPSWSTGGRGTSGLSDITATGGMVGEATGMVFADIGLVVASGGDVSGNAQTFNAAPVPIEKKPLLRTQTLNSGQFEASCL
jgi:hypothetical protein